MNVYIQPPLWRTHCIYIIIVPRKQQKCLLHNPTYSREPPPPHMFDRSSVEWFRTTCNTRLVFCSSSCRRSLKMSNWNKAKKWAVLLYRSNFHLFLLDTWYDGRRVWKAAIFHRVSSSRRDQVHLAHTITIHFVRLSCSLSKLSENKWGPGGGKTQPDGIYTCCTKNIPGKLTRYVQYDMYVLLLYCVCFRN